MLLQLNRKKTNNPVEKCAMDMNSYGKGTTSDREIFEQMPNILHDKINGKKYTIFHCPVCTMEKFDNTKTHPLCWRGCGSEI